MRRIAVAFVVFAVLLGAAANAPALCMNPDGSLDDVSVPEEGIDLYMLPACKDQAVEVAGISQAVTETTTQQKPAPSQSAEAAKPGGKRVSPADDRQTASGENRDYIDEAELMMLWFFNSGIRTANFETALSR
jgi:hypothetical protein